MPLTRGRSALELRLARLQQLWSDARRLQRLRGIRALMREAWDRSRNRLRNGVYNIGYRVAGSIDGYPLPPARLVQLVIGTSELAWYQLGGLFNHEAIRALLERNGCSVGSLKRILDFGCGCGRIVRWWAALRGRCEIWGTDYNPELVAWCQRHLSELGRFRVNGDDPPLDFDDASFDLVYSFSVFTHLASERQRPWFRELNRVLRPGGLAVVTVHGERAGLRQGWAAERLGELRATGLIVLTESASGTNRCVAYHSEGFMRGLAGDGLEVVDWVPGGTRDPTEQDLYLLRKPA